MRRVHLVKSLSKLATHEKENPSVDIVDQQPNHHANGIPSFVLFLRKNVPSLAVDGNLVHVNEICSTVL